MANHFRLFGRPLMADEVADGLSVTGVLEGYTAGEAYESRLSINNPVGRCTVEVIESTLPSGAAVRVDNITKEVVVKWAAFTEVVEEETLVPNGDFEAGDDGTWTRGGASNGEGWSIGTGSDYDTDSGVYSARFAGIKTGGSDLFNPLIPAKLNDYIRCTAQVQQGGSSKGKAGARVSIVYRNDTGAELQRNSGTLVSSGKDGNWSQSVAEGAAPKDTKYVQVVLSAFRSKQNKPLWVDTVKWNHKYALGQNDDSDYYLSLRVTDSTNRVAYWSGYVSEYSLMLLSQPYPVTSSDSVVAGGDFLLGNGWLPPAPLDSTTVVGKLLSAELVTLVNYTGYTIPADDELIIAGGGFVFGNLETLVSYETYSFVNDTPLQAGGSFRSADNVVIGINRTLPTESTVVGGSFISGTLA